MHAPPSAIWKILDMHFSFSGGLKSIERIIFLWASSCFRQAQEVIVLAKILAAEVNYGYEVPGKSGFSAPTHEKVVESHLFPMIFNPSTNFLYKVGLPL